MRHAWPRRVLPPEQVDSILLNLMLPIGDTLFVTPTLHAVRQRYPSAHIAALVFPTNAGVLRGNDDVDEVIIHPTGQTFTVRDYPRFIGRMRRRRFTMALEFRPYSWWMSALFGVWRRFSFDIPVQQWFVPGGPRPWRYRHAVASYASVVGPLNIAVTSSLLSVRTDDTARAVVARLLASHGVRGEQRLIIMHPGGEGFRGMKRWEPARFAALADRLARAHDAAIVLVGGRDELPLAHDTARAMDQQPVILTGSLSLGQTAALLERSYLFVGNDSAPSHMAGSLGIPTVALFGPTSTVNYRPVGPFVEVVRSNIVCSPCFFFVGSQPLWAVSRCRVPTCLHTLPVEGVVQAAESALERKRQDTAQSSRSG